MPAEGDTAYRSKANLALIARRGLTPQFQRAKPRGRPMPPHIARGNATRARVRSRVEHVFAAEKRRMGLLVRTIGLLRATAKITLANLAYNMRRFVWITGKPAPARRSERCTTNQIAEQITSHTVRTGNSAATHLNATRSAGYSRCPSVSSPKFLGTFSGL